MSPEKTTDWQPVSTAPIGEMVMTKIDDERGVRNEQPLCWGGKRLWFSSKDQTFYVYYIPTHWRPL